MTPPSPTQLKRALVARLEEVQKRLQGAGQLGESLVRQQRELQEKLKEVEAEAAKGGEISPELRLKLTALEKEYNEVHKESTRALISSKIHGGLDSPHKVCHIFCKYPSVYFRSTLDSTLLMEQAYNLLGPIPQQSWLYLHADNETNLQDQMTLNSPPRLPSL